jgi:probable HAF family extracellular repeat protein
MRLKSGSRALLVASIILAGTGHANASTYTFTDLGTLGGNPYASSYARAINASGQVVGIDADTIHYAMLWNGTTATVLSGLGGRYSYASAINASGQVAGGSQVYSDIGYGDEGAFHAVRWNGATPTDLGTLGGVNSDAYAINASGQVAGSSEVYSHSLGYEVRHATRWNGTTATDLGTLGGYQSTAYAINASGQVAGVAYTAGNAAFHATLWNGTTATDLGTLGGTFSTAYAINASGQVAGVAQTTSNGDHATLWNGTTATDLNNFLDESSVNLGWVLQEARGINDSGSIVGSAYNTITGQTHAYVLTAVPEPESYAMLLTGLGLLGFVARRRQHQAA